MVACLGFPDVLLECCPETPLTPLGRGWPNPGCRRGPEWSLATLPVVKCPIYISVQSKAVVLLDPFSGPPKLALTSGAAVLQLTPSERARIVEERNRRRKSPIPHPNYSGL